MKDLKLLLLIVAVLVSCAAPVTPTASVGTPVIVRPSPIATKATPSPGNVEGTISWLTSPNSKKIPISRVNLELNGHLKDNPRYTAKTDMNGHYSFENIEPNNYGLGVYLNLSVDQRVCEAPEYQYNQDLGWLHYATALRGDIWYDILFSSEDVVLSPGETVFVNFVLKCP